MEFIGTSIQVPEVSLHIRILEVLGPQFISSHHVRIWKYWDLKILSGELLVGRRTECIQIRISPSKLGPGKKTSVFVSGSRICEEDNQETRDRPIPTEKTTLAALLCAPTACDAFWRWRIARFSFLPGK
jgi:hypothetical protein